MASGSWKDFDFPFLNSRNHKITSPRSVKYNCIAWAAGDNTRWWCPRRFWPKGVAREVTMEAFMAVFASLGYEPCADGILEQGYEKIALFAHDKEGVAQPTHAARQLGDGKWTSKLGALEDIEHAQAENVAGDCYGKVTQFMRRAQS